ncbi:hypothetical protein HYC85_020779 [Camellia sinensis]|uniref:RNase H type-1 domain-containing protein n=1 Tax=Camellia sinensis TaxID=4442 RepID=A0A7J7GRR3_CAMSI|nr:hypothetical protein HYC85_020779 [Camellia sinensis]
MVDELWWHEDGSASIAWICYRDDGESMAQRAQQMHLASPFATEVMACHQAIQWAKEQNLCKVSIWTDSQLLVDVLCNRVSPFCSSITIIADIKLVSKFFDYLCICKVKQQDVKPTHDLARSVNNFPT